jgi:hypothetical protein
MQVAEMLQNIYSNTSRVSCIILNQAILSLSCMMTKCIYNSKVRASSVILLTATEGGYLHK